MAMKKHFILFACALIMSAATSGRCETARTDINPALTYYQAFSARPELSTADSDFLFTNVWQGQKLPDRVGQLLGSYDSSFNLIRQASHSTAPCDWGIDWSAGPNTLLPHLPRIKNLALTARLRVLWDLQQGKQTDARDDLMATLAMARNGATDPCLISALVQIAVERIVCESVAENFGRFSPEVLQQIADGMNQTPPRGTIATSVTFEKPAFADWTINRLQQLKKENPGDDAKAIEGIRSIFNSEDGSGQTTNRWPQMVAASGGTVDGMIKLIRDMDPVYAKMSDLQTLPLAQYEAQVKILSNEVESSTNPFVHELVPAVEKCRPKEFTILAELAMVQAAVQYKLHGTSGLQTVADPLGQGPFSFQRFIYDGVDRGFELTSPYAGQGFQTALIFVETEGQPFNVDGKRAGEAMQ
jgi:hypothetical protein